MTDTTLTHTALTEVAETAGVTTDQARTILEAAGVKVRPEKPEPGLYMHEDGRPIIVDEKGGWWHLNLEEAGMWWMDDENHSGRLTPARIVPVTATPVTLTEDQVGELWGEESTPLGAWSALVSRNRERITATVNAALAQHAAPAEGEPIADAVKPIDLDDVREGDRVRLELDNGDEATITVTRVAPDFLTSERYVFYAREIRSVHLLHREEA